MINRFKKYYNVNNIGVTPPPPPESTCYPFELVATTSSSIIFQFDTCSGETTNITVPGNQRIEICASKVYRPNESEPKWTIITGANLCEYID